MLAGSALAGVCVAAGCSSPAAPAPAADGSHRAVTPSASRAPTSSPTPPRPSPTPTPPPAPHVTVSRVRMADGSIVTVAAFRGPVQYVLHNGSGDPGPLAAGRVTAGPAVGAAERPRLLAAFNGGFKLSAGAGGYEQEGHVIATLRTGLASLVIDRSGQARIGIWGHNLPAPNEAVYSVRQNLQPLVYHGQPTAASADWGLWGATLGGGEYVARSAVGQDGYGDLLFAGGASTSPADLAAALASRGARIAMELDINPEWVQLDIAAAPGGPLTAAIPGQVRSASQFLSGWTRDFFTVLGPS